MKTSVKKPSIIMTFRVQPELKRDLQKLSEFSDRSQAYLIEKAVEQFVEENSALAKILKEREKEADKGIFVSHEKVVNWIQDLRKNPSIALPEPDIFE
jgi:predicted transcriptional regulator